MTSVIKKFALCDVKVTIGNTTTNLCYLCKKVQPFSPKSVVIIFVLQLFSKI